MLHMDQKIAGTIFACLMVLFFLAAAGCTGSAPVTHETPAVQTPEETLMQSSVPSPGSPEDIREVAGANNQFAFSLYSRLSKENGNSETNLFFSPLSLSSALALTYEGARGKTADEIQTVFFFPRNRTALRSGYSGMNAAINSGDSRYTLRTANALWAENTYPFLSEYIATASRDYDAKTTNLDFINHPEEARLTINSWVENRTENRIRDLIPAGAIDPATRLVITNAIYFKGTWEKQFDRNETVEADFRTGTGTTVKVPMMQRTDEEAIYPYTETASLQMISMPYDHSTGRNLSMIVLLPKSDSLAATESSLDAGSLASLQQSAESQRVMVYFPKFTLSTRYSLPGELSALGMPTAFTPSADFSGMDGKNDLLISDVIHQAFVDVNEEGTEAAAATAVVMKMAALPGNPRPIPVFRADHPFIFIIQDNDTGAILFIGRVVNPAGT